MLPKSLGQHQRETAKREADELFEIVNDCSDVADRLDTLCHRYGAQVNGCKVEELCDYLNTWLGRWEEQLADLWKESRGLPQ